MMPSVAQPPAEDSPDLTLEEAERATNTTNPRELAQLIGTALEGRYVVSQQEIRRRGGHLYLRVTFEGSEPSRKTLVYRTDWMADG